MKLLLLTSFCFAVKNNLYSQTGVIESFETQNVFIKERMTSTMVNLHYLLDIEEKENDYQTKSPCLDSDGFDYGDQYRAVIRKEVFQSIEKRADSTLAGTLLKKATRSKREINDPPALVYQ